MIRAGASLNNDICPGIKVRNEFSQMRLGIYARHTFTQNYPEKVYYKPCISLYLSPVCNNKPPYTL
jgi:hypothetical protein